MPDPAISVCILSGHGIQRLAACLTSLEAQASPPPFELVVGGNATPQVRSLVVRHFPDAQVCDTSRQTVGSARNALIERASGDLVLFLDDDVTAPPGLLRSLADAAVDYPEASVFGGPNCTPIGASRFEIVQGAVLASPVGAGPVSRRYRARRSGFVDDRWFAGCNLAFRGTTMLPFMSRLPAAEENELLGRLQDQGELMRYEPGLSVYHARRPTWRSFAVQMYKYGRGRGHLLASRPKSFRAAYVTPLALLAYVLALLVVWIITANRLPLLALAPLGLYCGLVGATALRVAGVLRMPLAALLAAPLLVTIHVFYGAGTFRGLTTVTFWRARHALSTADGLAPAGAD